MFSLQLLLKITLAPALVAAASLAGRRFGPRVSGWLIGFPVVAGPVLWFYAREQGSAFAAGAAAGTLLGLLALTAFVVIYAWGALRLHWLPSMLLGWVGFVVVTLTVDRIPAISHAGPGRWPLALIAAFVALTLGMHLLPRLPDRLASPPPRNDLLLRMLATAALVLTLTGLAHTLGPALSGLFTPFPVATSVLVVFAHRQAGPAGVLAVYRGFIPSLYSFACFCAALAFALPRWPVGLSFAFALLISLVTQTIVLWAGPPR